MNLQALQTSFQDIVLNANCTGADWVSQSAQPLSSKQRLAIYHNAYRVRLIDVLMDTFEHTAIYLGDDWFHKLAAAFVQANHSTHNNIGNYGTAFPAFLAEQLPKDLDVAEMAQMDWHLRRAFDGADAEVMTLVHLQQLAAGELQIDTLKLVPALSVIQQHHNTLDIWQAINLEQQPPDVQALSEPVHILIWRKGHSPHFRSLSGVEATAIASVSNGDSLDGIGTRLATNFPDIDVATEFGVMLNRWIDEQILMTP